MHILSVLVALYPRLLTHVGVSIKVRSEPYMALTVESIGPSATGRNALSICHYGEQNGDLMRDPEMCFELHLDEKSGRGLEFLPYYWRNDYAGVEREGTSERFAREYRDFVKMWDSNLEAQGFIAAIEAGKAEVSNG